MVNRPVSFAEFAKRTRLEAHLGLREAARKMGISAAYLSRVENDVDPPSADLIIKMSREYACDLEELNAAARRPSISATTRGKSLQLSEELRALYRIGGALSAAEVEDMIRHVLKNRKMTDEEIEKELSNLRSELPRIRNSQREGLFAADIRPRVLSKRRVVSMAYDLLSQNGLDHDRYLPPTPVERLVEGVDGITYEIRDLPSKDGEPIVLGLSRRDRGFQRQVVINSVLADSNRATDTYRFNFTLAHELFHAIEHLTIGPNATPTGMMRYSGSEAAYVERRIAPLKPSRAERAVNIWAKADRSRARLFTNEDWREWQANTFAAALLMPEWALVDMFKFRLGDEYLLIPEGSTVREFALEVAGTREFRARIFEESLAERFAVSRQAMAIRMIDLGLIREVAA
jgi:Zn-dependent peptidase ImmA (M78 family)/transcriptional regulator with XRE-family HTH domain